MNAQGFPVLEMFPAPGGWIADAACRGVDPNVFFPQRHVGWAPSREAKAICAGCPVIVLCRDYAVAHAAIRGVWGGLSHRERLVLRRGEVAA